MTALKWSEHTERAKRFMAANAESPVVSAESTKEGSAYTLENGRVWKLTYRDKATLPLPRWHGD